MATIEPKEDFSAEEAAEQLRAAMKGLGTNESEIIDALCRHSCEQRQDIATWYKTAFGKDLIDELKSELGGHFEDAVLGLMSLPRLYDARELHKAMKGAGTDETPLIEIMCSRSNDEIAEIKAIYKKEFHSDLEKDLKSETSGYFKRLLVSQCTGGRTEGDDVDEYMGQDDAEKIYNAGEAQLGTDEAAINSVLATRNYAQLREMFGAYDRLTGHTIEEAISKECSGTLEDGFLAIVGYARNPSLFFANRLYKSMKGLGTDDNTLIRIIVSRSEVDLRDIEEAFFDKYEKTLSSFVEDDCNGDYKRILLRICNEGLFD